MEDRERAFFVRTPRRLEDLRCPHLRTAERGYEIIKVVELDEMDYENFSTDLLADRVFLEGLPEEKWNENIHRCILVRRSDSIDGILVVPTSDAHVRLAAYYTPCTFADSAP